MKTPTSQTSNNEWNVYWENDSTGGEVFVGKDGQAHPDIAAWWQTKFSDLPSKVKIVDLASGSGSVFQHLANDNDAELHAADISEEALNYLTQQFTNAKTVTSAADSLPYEDDYFGFVVSQFGIEYAGAKAFSEAVRILAPEGKLRMLCHIRDGHIDSRNQAHLAHAQTALDSDFITLARDLIVATDAGAQTTIEAAATSFQSAERQLANACRDLPEGIHMHLYQGFRQLYQNKAEYSSKDILDWLASMQFDVTHNISRLQNICNVALSEIEMTDISNQMRDAGSRMVCFEPFFISGHEAPLAWAVEAEK